MNFESHPLFPPDRTRQQKDTRARIRRYLLWLFEQDRPWHKPDLDAYAQHLLEDTDLNRYSVVVYVGAVRKQYERLLETDQLLENLSDTLFRSDVSLADIREGIEVAVTDQARDITYDRSKNQASLSQQQVESLIDQIDLTRWLAVRDRILLGCMLTAGLSEQELVRINLDDVTVDEHSVYLRVPESTNREGRADLLLDDSLFWASPWLYAYMQTWKQYVTGAEGKALFRGFYRGGNTLRSKRISPKGIQQMLQRYPVPGEENIQETYTAMDLRRTFVRRATEEGLDKEEILKRLGYTDIYTINRYLGTQQESNYDKGDPTKLLIELKNFKGE